ncbi:MAG TPA: hypothetical protein VMX74_13530, partial [Pirellulales bacterium]|nr:hypothetical protein [Pirellulales bacterium]
SMATASLETPPKLDDGPDTIHSRIEDMASDFADVRLAHEALMVGSVQRNLEYTRSAARVAYEHARTGKFPEWPDTEGEGEDMSVTIKRGDETHYHYTSEQQQANISGVVPSGPDATSIKDPITATIKDPITALDYLKPIAGWKLAAVAATMLGSSGAIGYLSSVALNRPDAAPSIEKPATPEFEDTYGSGQFVPFNGK